MVGIQIPTKREEEWCWCHCRVFEQLGTFSVIIHVCVRVYIFPSVYISVYLLKRSFGFVDIRDA